MDQEDFNKLVEDMRFFDFPEEQISEVVAQHTPLLAPRTFLVARENATAVRLMLATATQWRMAAVSTMSRAEIVRTGLDYVGVEAAARMAGIEITGDDFGRLRALEAEALNAWTEERRAQR